MLDNEEDVGDMDFTSLPFILQNLRLANEDLYSDPSLTITSRNYISRSTCLQICFYLSLALKAFTRPPTILLFGAGHTGSLLIDSLVEFKLGSCLKIFARGDYATKYWNSRKLHSGSSLAELLGENKADIVIMCSGMSSFGSMCRGIIPFVSRATFFISSCFGLSRKRIFKSLKTPNVFRTFQEPQIALNKCSSRSAYSIHDPNYGIEGVDTPADSHDASSTSLSFEQQSADLLVKRCPNIRNMIYLLENYYALRGMTPTMARKESIGSLLGRNTDEIVTEEMPYQGKNQFIKNRNSPPMTPNGVNRTALKHWAENENEDEADDSSTLGTGTDDDASKGSRSISVSTVSELRRHTHVAISADGTRTAHIMHSRRKKEIVPETPEPATVKVVKDPTGLVVAQKLLAERVAGPFQKYFSKFIRVSDIPRCDDIDGSDANAVQLEVVRRLMQEQEELRLMSAEDNFVSNSRNKHRMNGFGRSPVKGSRGLDPHTNRLPPQSQDQDQEVSVNVKELNPNDQADSGMRLLGLGSTSNALDKVLLSSDPLAAMENLMHIIPHIPHTEDTTVAAATSEGVKVPVESQYDAKRRQLEELRVQTKVKLMEELDSAPKIKEPIGAAMHSDEELELIFGEDSRFHDDSGSLMEETSKSGKAISFKLKHRQTTELIAMLREIEAEEARHSHD